MASAGLTGHRLEVALQATPSLSNSQSVTAVPLYYSLPLFSPLQQQVFLFFLSLFLFLSFYLFLSISFYLFLSSLLFLYSYLFLSFFLPSIHPSILPSISYLFFSSISRTCLRHKAGQKKRWIGPSGAA